jgi:hypothetical protein
VSRGIVPLCKFAGYSTCTHVEVSKKANKVLLAMAFNLEEKAIAISLR